MGGQIQGIDGNCSPSTNFVPNHEPSRRRNSGLRNRARARAIRMRHPPLKDLVGCCCMALVNPNPCKMDEARCSAVAASSSSRLISIIIYWCTHEGERERGREGR